MPRLERAFKILKRVYSTRTLCFSHVDSQMFGEMKAAGFGNSVFDFGRLKSPSRTVPSIHSNIFLQNVLTLQTKNQSSVFFFWGGGMDFFSFPGWL